MRYVAFCTKGLEDMVTSEISSVVPDVTFVEKKDKRVIFETTLNPHKLTELKTVDDLGIFLKEFQVQTLNDVTTALEMIDLRLVRDQITKIRALTQDTFSITMSVARARINLELLQKRLQSFISQTYQWTYAELDHTNFDLRVFIDGREGLIAVRLTSQSLHHRNYKMQSKSGSLKPTVAAAMVRLAGDGRSNLKVVDTFCGSGTILCEAALKGYQVFGSDIDPLSIQITKANLSNVIMVPDDSPRVLDAGKTTWSPAFFDAAISNLPWDRQIKVESITSLFIGALTEFSRIVKSDGVVCLLVTKPELLIKHAKKIFPQATIQEYKIGLLGQTPSIILIQR